MSILERRRIATAGIAYFAALCLLASFFGTWADEEYTLATTAHGFAYAWHRAITYELQAPLYFGVFALWRALDPAIWFARLFSILCATGSFFAFAAIGRRVAPKRDPLAFALLAALNPFAIVAAFQIRLYALGLLLTALMWIAFDDGFFTGASRRSRVAFVVLSIVAIYVQYFLGFLIVGFAIALLVAGRTKPFFAFAGCGIVAAIAAAPLVILARSQAAGYAPEPSSHFSIAFMTLLHPWLEFFVPHIYTVSETRFEHLTYLVLAIVLGACAAASAPNITRRLVATIVPAVVIELVYVALAVAADQRLNDRYFVALYVPVAVAAYAYLRASKASPPVPQRIVVGIVTVATLASLISNYRFLAQTGDWMRVGAYLERNARPGDVIVVYASDNLPALERFYHGAIRVVPFPRPASQSRYEVSEFDVDSETAARDAFARVGPYRTLWFVDSVACTPGHIEYGCENVERAVARDFAVRSDRAFYMNSVRALTGRGAATQAQHAARVGEAREQHVAIR